MSVDATVTKPEASALVGLIDSLKRRYLFTDGTVESVWIEGDGSRFAIECSFPILPDHPEYSQKRMRSNFKKGFIYSPQDWRGVELIFSEITDLTAKLHGTDLPLGQSTALPWEMIIDQLEIGLGTLSNAWFSLSAEGALLIHSRFSGLAYKEVGLSAT